MTRRQRIVHAFQDFISTESVGGILLLACTVIALVWANSPWAHAYTDLWHSPMGFTFGPFQIEKDLQHWINDGLMAVFFFVVGLEIKREILVGELATARKAALPAAAAVGGMVVPALLYMALNAGGVGRDGWGVPMATDIAFALGVLALLGKRVPLSAKVFLTALAIVDDLGAVLVIAVFYTSEVAFSMLGWAGLVLFVMIAANRMGVRRPGVFVLLGIILWFLFLQSGVHATVAGVLAALTIPAGGKMEPGTFRARTRELLEDFPTDEGPMLSGAQQERMWGIQELVADVATPLQRLEHDLHPWVSFGIMPIFALANAGVALGGDAGAALTSPIALGIVLGLVLGKPIGIAGFAWLATRIGWAEMPVDMTNRHVLGTAVLGGIGFTMSLFIAQLAFADAALLTTAKLGILAASVVAGVVGWLILSRGRAET